MTGLDCNRMEPFVFSDESGYNLNSDDYHVHVWRSRAQWYVHKANKAKIGPTQQGCRKTALARLPSSPGQSDRQWIGHIERSCTSQRLRLQTSDTLYRSVADYHSFSVEY
ncbi:hypothetical protein TNCV_3214331 [Trichonephila clavipes]|nr:hypothetical protein TNCV_3214331 [Trichonephila clavipes]